MNGKIHSFQSLGAVDGPGLRYVVFMQGCTLRCVYCHNPDTWNLSGEEFTIEEVLEKIKRFTPYFAEKGGVTVSGGEPLLQWEFVSELFLQLHKVGIHTVLDTSGIGNLDGAQKVLKNTDLVICDLKFSNETDYLKFSNGNMKTVTAFLKLTETMSIPLWIRHVVVPKLTDSEENILKTASLSSQYSNLQKIELLPFRKLCETKYDDLGLAFPLFNYDECKDITIQNLNKLINN